MAEAFERAVWERAVTPAVIAFKDIQSTEAVFYIAPA
jgi:hypothetical protein